MKERGTLYGVGVGPGDPELLSLKAVRILNQVPVIFAAHSSKNNYSLAKEIISPHVPSSTPVVRLDFPMTRSKEELECAWKRNADSILDRLNQGEDAAFVTLGDPMIYSTFGYIMRTIRSVAPDVSIEIVPGISSYQAAAAASGSILAEAEGSFTVISGAMGARKLKEVIDAADSIVMLKVYKNYKEILEALEELELKENSVLVSRCGLEGERIVQSLQGPNGDRPPYLTTLIVRKGRLKK